MTDSYSIKIALADDHTMFRESLVDILGRRPGFTVIGQASNGADLVEGLQRAGIAPDVCILDVNMPSGGGHAAVALLRDKYPEARIVILSMLDHEALILKMFHAGVAAYITKDRGTDQLCAAITAAATGRFYFPGESGDKIFGQLQPGRLQYKNRKITPKEEEFLGWCLHPEMGYKHIADAMGVTERTVNGYRESVFLKLSVNSRAGLLLAALQLGIRRQ